MKVFQKSFSNVHKLNTAFQAKISWLGNKNLAQLSTAWRATPGLPNLRCVGVRIDFHNFLSKVSVSMNSLLTDQKVIDLEVRLRACDDEKLNLRVGIILSQNVFRKLILRGKAGKVSLVEKTRLYGPMPHCRVRIPGPTSTEILGSPKWGTGRWVWRRWWVWWTDWV